MRAEVYGRDLGFADMEEDQKINYGEHVLKAAFINYMKAAEYRYVTQGYAPLLSNFPLQSLTVSVIGVCLNQGICATLCRSSCIVWPQTQDLLCS